MSSQVNKDNPSAVPEVVDETHSTLKAAPALLQFMAGPIRQGFVEGPLGYIVTDTDFCHCIRGLRENIDLAITWSWEGDEHQLFTLESLRAISTPVTSFRKWGHYWGLKGRIHANYRELLTNMQAIGADITGMPEWGEEPACEPYETRWQTKGK